MSLESRLSSYKRLAEARGGELAYAKQRDIFSTTYPNETSADVEYRHRLGPVEMRLDTPKSYRAPYRTTVAIRGPFQVPRIEIYPEWEIHELAKMFGMQDIEIGVPRFD